MDIGNVTLLPVLFWATARHCYPGVESWKLWQPALLTLIGFDDTPGTFVFNETGYTFSGHMPWLKFPLPAAVWLFGSALMGLVAVRRRPRPSKGPIPLCTWAKAPLPL